MSLQNIIETAFENRAEINPNTVTSEVREAVLETIHQLDSGKLRVAERLGVGEWKVNEWAKKAVLLSFRIQDNEILNDGVNKYFDKVPTKFADWSEDEFRSAGFRAVPGAVARRGSFVAKNVVLMPSYVNIGAYVDEGAMVDTWATVGSCAQIGKNVHLSGGVGIGGVLEPVQAQPVIIEDHCFIGSRCVVVEGVHLEEEVVLGANTVITGSTKVIDASSKELDCYEGVVPARSVVIPGSYTKHFPAGDFQVPCALIIGKRKASTDLKTSLNEALRDFNIPV